MNESEPPDFREPKIAYGIISGSAVRNAYPVEDRERLERIFKEDFDRSRAIGNDASSCAGVSQACVDVFWKYDGVHIFDRGFLLIGNRAVLQQFMERYRAPYALKNEGESDFVSVFTGNSEESISLYIGDLTAWNEIIIRIYEQLKPLALFEDCILMEAGHQMANSGLDILHDFIRNMRQNGRVTLEKNEQITLNTDRSRREIALLDHPVLQAPKHTSRPSFAHVLQMVTAEPVLDPLVISDTDAAQHLRKTVQIQGVVTESKVNRRGDVLLIFGAAMPNNTFTGCIPTSSGLTNDETWIQSLIGKTIRILGKIEFYSLKPTIRITKKHQVRVV
jgi:hypothetical protein